MTTKEDIMISGALGVGNHIIQVDIDYPSQIPETNEFDNTFTRTFTVQPGNCVSTPIFTIFNGDRTFNTEHYQATNFRIKDQCQTSILTIRNWNSTTNTSNNPLEIISPNNSWNSNWLQQWGGSTIWAAKSSYKYFSDVHSRNSYDGANGLLNGFVNAVFSDGSTNNASMSFTGGTMKVGLGSTNTLANSWGTLDIIGHEYGHAVTGSSANLAYLNESGALNESFSDIFGECIENYTLGSNDWLLGANRTPSVALRSMSNPNTYDQPDTYAGTNWRTDPTFDNGGVHFNSGVQNYWFYLLSQGGSGTNDNNNAFNVPALGISKARAIAFQTLTSNLLGQPNANYAMARNASILSAQQIYGANSTEVNAVINAWCAVGVGTAPTVTVSGGGIFCTPATINASGGAGGTIYFQGNNSNGTSTSSTSTSQTITTSGTYYFRAQNGCGWGPSVGVSVTINSVPSAVSVSGGGVVCNSTTLIASGGSGGTIYWQNTTNGGTSTGIFSSSQTITTPGTYYFRAYNSNCGWGPQGNATVTIQTTPSIVTVSGGGTYCNSATITASGGSGGTIYYQENTSNGTSFWSTSTSHVPTNSGTHYYRSYNSACLWGPQGSATVTINKVPTAVNVSVSGGSPSCNSATLLTSGGTNGTIYWQGLNNNGTSQSIQLASQSVSTSGTYYFRANNSCGWGPQGSATVTIQTTPAAVSITGSGNVCNSTTITASGGAGGTIYWQGTNNNGVSTAIQSMSQPITSSGTYYFRAFNAACGWGAQGSTTITIITEPSAVNVSGGGTICGNSTTLNANGGNGGTVYWQGTNSNGTSTATQSISQIISATGTYYFRANNGCGWGTVGSATVTIVPTSMSLNGTATTGLRKAVNTISSNQSIVSGRNVSYEAGKSIELTGVFSAANGSVFRAEIKTCN